MKRIILTFIIATSFIIPAEAKIEAFAIMTKHCGKNNLKKAAHGGVVKIVSEINGKGLHGYVIELDLSLMNKVQLTENLIQQGCYKTRRTKTKAKLLPEDLLSDEALTNALLETADT